MKGHNKIHMYTKLHSRISILTPIFNESEFSARTDKSDGQDGRTDGPTDGRTDGPTDGRTDRRTDGPTDGPTKRGVESRSTRLKTTTKSN